MFGHVIDNFLLLCVKLFFHLIGLLQCILGKNGFCMRSFLHCLCRSCLLLLSQLSNRGRVLGRWTIRTRLLRSSSAYNTRWYVHCTRTGRLDSKHVFLFCYQLSQGQFSRFNERIVVKRIIKAIKIGIAGNIDAVKVTRNTGDTCVHIH